MTTPHGWLIRDSPVTVGAFSLIHSNGFYVDGFDSKDDALCWLHSYLMGQQARRYEADLRVERARMRILARMTPQGRVS